MPGGRGESRNRGTTGAAALAKSGIAGAKRGAGPSEEAEGALGIGRCVRVFGPGSTCAPATTSRATAKQEGRARGLQRAALRVTTGGKGRATGRQA